MGARNLHTLGDVLILVDQSAEPVASSDVGDTYAGIWRQDDWLTVTERGGVVVSGRSDATLDRGGVRLGSAEIYGVVESMPEITNSLVVGIELPDGGYTMQLFVVPTTGIGVDDDLRARIAQALRQHLSPDTSSIRSSPFPVSPHPHRQEARSAGQRLLQGATIAGAASAGSVDRPELLAWYAEPMNHEPPPMQEMKDIPGSPL